MTSRSGWTFLTNHAAVLLTVASGPDLTLHQIADRVGITERAVHRIVTDLVDGGYLVVNKLGRQNHYRVVTEAHLRHRAADHVEVGALLEVLRREDADPG